MTLRETDMVLRGLTIAQKSLKEHLEVIGHKEAFDYVKQLVSKNAQISEKLIKDIHYLVLADKNRIEVYTEEFLFASWVLHTSPCNLI